MRNTLITLLLIAGFLLSGIFVVDQREVATSFSKNKVILYAPGVHWKLPFWGQMDFVYTNLRTSYLTLPQIIKFPDPEEAQIAVIVDWQVVKPGQYVKYSTENTLKGFDVKLVSMITEDINNLAKRASSLKEFENLLNSQAHNISHDELGIEIVNIALVNVILVPKPSVSGHIESDLGDSYLLAQQIKNNADQEQSAHLAKLRNEDSHFFGYYMKIRHYQETAHRRQDVPPLTELYSY